MIFNLPHHAEDQSATGPKVYSLYCYPDCPKSRQQRTPSGVRWCPPEHQQTPEYSLDSRAQEKKLWVHRFQRSTKL